MSNELRQPETPGPGSSDSVIDAYLKSIFGDGAPEFHSLNERRHLVGVARSVASTVSSVPYDFSTFTGDQVRPSPTLQPQVLNAVRREAARSVETPASAFAHATSSPLRPAARWLRRFRVRLAILAVGVVAAITALFSSFGSSPVVAASLTLAPGPGSPSPTATGTADFLRHTKGAGIDRVRMKVYGLAPSTSDTHYECWLVASGDAPATPRRILVGTFSTRTGDATFGWKAAGYSADFRQLDVSLEKTDGDAAYGGVTVLTTVTYSGKRTG